MTIPDIVDPEQKLTGKWWMQAAQAAVRAYAGWHVAPVITETLRTDAYGGRVLQIASKHVVEIEKIEVYGADWTSEVDWSEAGTLQLRRGHWPDAPGAVQVTLTHGYELEVVPQIAALIVAVGKRARSMPGPVMSQSVNGSSVTYMSGGGAPLGVPLLNIEKEMLAPYRLVWGP